MNPMPDRFSRLRRQRMRAAACWLFAGTALLLLTPLTLRTDSLGWAPALWLVGAPLLLLLVLEPRLPLQLLAKADQAVPRRLRSMRRRNSRMMWR
ncbi:MAG TPA: hypothetical protein VFJ04_01300 [Rhodanobacteraceae bacterium]|nr:hypothetical protein [Rhodanobacteraceae bacterium]